MQWFSNCGIAASQSESPGLCPLKGQGGQQSDQQNLITGACLDLPDHAADSRWCGESHASLRRAPQHAETQQIMIVTHFRLTITKPEVGRDHYFDCLGMLGSPVEAGAGLFAEPGVGSSRSKQAPAPLGSVTILAIASLPPPSPASTYSAVKLQESLRTAVLYGYKSPKYTNSNITHTQYTMVWYKCAIDQVLRIGSKLCLCSAHPNPLMHGSPPFLYFTIQV